MDPSSIFCSPDQVDASYLFEFKVDAVELADLVGLSCFPATDRSFDPAHLGFSSHPAAPVDLDAFVSSFMDPEYEPSTSTRQTPLEDGFEPWGLPSSTSSITGSDDPAAASLSCLKPGTSTDAQLAGCYEPGTSTSTRDAHLAGCFEPPALQTSTDTVASIRTNTSSSSLNSSSPRDGSSWNNDLSTTSTDNGSPDADGSPNSPFYWLSNDDVARLPPLMVSVTGGFPVIVQQEMYCYAAAAAAPVEETYLLKNGKLDFDKLARRFFLLDFQNPYDADKLTKEQKQQMKEYKAVLPKNPLCVDCQRPDDTKFYDFNNHYFRQVRYKCRACCTTSTYGAKPRRRQRPPLAPTNPRKKTKL